ncbi:hypothetical protein BASA81_003759 [Batrachochytrium salamandrivorans]|nr:hypothetical protein BASA81_003759 [Batrachochytrium salamandrivorans]
MAFAQWKLDGTLTSGAVRVPVYTPGTDQIVASELVQLQVTEYFYIMVAGFGCAVLSLAFAFVKDFSCCCGEERKEKRGACCCF